MITKFVWMGPIGPQQYDATLMLPISEVHGVGPGFISVSFSAVPIKADNDEKYVIGG